MSVMTHVGPNGAVSHEYTGQIDFRINACRTDWQVFVVVPVKSALHFTMGLTNLSMWDRFQIKERPLTHGSGIALTFKPRPLSEDVLIDARRKLLRFLTKHKLKIIWKEAHHGYEIQRSGRVYRKWRLNTVWERLPGPVNF